MTSRAYKSESARQKVMESYSSMLDHWKVSFEEKDIDTGFGKTHVIIFGSKDKPPLLLLHGGGGNSTMWFPNVSDLGKCFRIYALDIIGEMGKSDDTRLPYDSDDYSDWIKESLQGLGLNNSNLIGTSLGATLSLKFAVKFPKLVDKVILVAPPSLEKMNAAFALRGLITALIPLERTIKGFYNYITSPNSTKPPGWAMRDQIIRAKAQRINSNPVPVVSEEDLSKLPESTLFILGKDDPIYPIDTALAKLRRAAPQVKTTVIEDAGHVITVEQPKRFIDVVFKFMGVDHGGMSD